MSSDRCLGDIVEIVMGQSPSGDACNVTGNGIPLLNGPTEFGRKYPHPVQFTTDPKKTSLTGDLLFCVRGSTTGRMNWADQKYAIGRGLAAIRGKHGYPNSFVRAVIETNLDCLLVQATGSTFPNVSRDLICGLSIPSVTQESAKLIASIVEPIDERITLLHEANATLESIAQALFKSWFVDFDPVRAKMEGLTPEGMDEATAALFPDSFEESEMGLVPKRWQVSNFADVATITSGKRPASRSDTKIESDCVPLYGGAGLMGYTSESLFDSTRILTGRVGTLGKVNVAYPPFWASDNVLVVTPKSSAFHSFVLNWLKEIDVHSLNRGSTQPLLTQRDLGAQIGVVPPTEVLEAYEENVSVMYESIREVELRIATLMDLRDTLLPRLISGQLRLTEIDS